MRYRKLLRTLFLIGVLASISSCNSRRRTVVHEAASSKPKVSTQPVLFSGEVEFKNTGSARLSVETTEGFEREPPCGFFRPGISSTSMMGPMAVPSTIVLIWNKEGENKQRTELTIPAGTIHSDTDKLLIEFHRDEKWSVSLAPN